ncbi:MAG: hypothetical protein H0W69_04285 [Gemmatimonadaceae bacterium]|nr:hypothetical protein [Gemmatimonadaceae bacterium]
MKSVVCVAFILLLCACTDIPSGAGAVASIQFDSLPSPSVVLGDTLRDESGRVAPLSARAFAYGAREIIAPPFRYSTLDRGLTIDSVTGRVIGDSVRATPARVIAAVAGLQALLPIPVVFKPDTVVISAGRDSLAYSLTDSTVNISPSLSVVLRHTLTQPDSLVRSYLVKFAITNQADTLAAQLVNDAGGASSRDTTDLSGTASRKLRIRPTRLKSITDSVVVSASVTYRGAHVRGSPARLVLKVKPK